MKGYQIGEIVDGIGNDEIMYNTVYLNKEKALKVINKLVKKAKKELKEAYGSLDEIPDYAMPEYLGISSEAFSICSLGKEAGFFLREVEIVE